jgi:hypothetical protein
MSRAPRRSYVHAFRRDHRALLGRPGSGRDGLGVAVHVRAGAQLASDRDADDAVRRYSISGLPFLGPVWVSTAQTWGDAFSAPYMHQCATTVTVEGDATLDLTVSSTMDLVALNASTLTPPNSRIVSGTVFEIMADGRQPVRNVWVGWEAAMDGFVAETRTDAAGHYRLCGLPRERITISAALAYGIVFNATVDLGSDVIVDIEIASKED